MQKISTVFFNILKSNKSLLFGGVVTGLFFFLLTLLITDFSAVILCLFVVSGIFSVSIYDFFSRKSVERNFSSFEDIVTRISKGDLSDSLFYRKDRGHIDGNLYFSIRKLVAEWRRVIGRFRRISRDLEKTSESILDMTDNLQSGSRNQRESIEEVHESLEEINNSIRGLRDSVSDLIDFTDDSSSSILEMTANIEDVAGNTANLMQYVEDTAAAMLQMASSVNEVAVNSKELYARASDNAASMAEMDASIEEVGENAKLTTSITEAVLKSAQEGKDSVIKTSNGLKSIEASVEQATNAINSLGDQSGQIGKIVKVIKEIADKTNLLALNAAIIAAQAGKEGKGFAVVAEEIRELSERTTGSAIEISKMIKSIQVEVQKAVDIMKTGSDRVKDGVELGQNAEESLDVILERTKRSTESIMQIAKATAEQAKGTKKISESIDEMTDMIESISAATEEQAATGNDIRDRADHMRDLTEHVSKAMEQQMVSSRSISLGMEKVNSVVSGVGEAIKNLSGSTEKVIKAMDIIRQAARDNRSGARNLYYHVTTFKHESAFLKEEIKMFKLPTPKKGNTLKLAYLKTTDPNMDPSFAVDIKNGSIVNLLYDGLVRYGDGTDIHPALASGWSISKDGKKFTFYLNPELKFHNGEPVTAHDVKASFERVLNPEIPTPSTWPLEPISGAAEFMKGEADEVKGITVFDAQTVSIELREPVAFFLGMLTLPETYVLPACMRSKSGKEFNSGPVGTGPFVFEEFEPNSHLKFKRNPDYFRQDIPYIDELTIKLDLEDNEDLPELMDKGEVDLSVDVNIEDIIRLQEHPKWASNIQSAVVLSTSFMTLNRNIPPFDNPKVRQAACYAVNKSELIRTVHGDMFEVANGIFPPGILGYDRELPGYEYNPDKARKLLREAGHESDVDVIFYRSSAERKIKDDAKCVIDYMNDAGFNVVEEVIDDSAYRRMMEEKKLPMRWTGWFADYPDPDNFLHVLFHSKSGDVLGMGFNNEEVDRIVEEARLEIDVKVIAKLYQRAERIVVEEAPCIFVYHQRSFVVHRSNIGGVKISITPPFLKPEEVWVQK